MQFSLPIACQWSLSIPPENIRKLEVSWCFQEVHKETRGMNEWFKQFLVGNNDYFQFGRSSCLARLRMWFDSWDFHNLSVTFPSTCCFFIKALITCLTLHVLMFSFDPPENIKSLVLCFLGDENIKFGRKGLIFKNASIQTYLMASCI